MNQNVLLISYHFHPSPAIGARRPTKLANYMVSKDVNVTVICKKNDVTINKDETHSSLSVNAVYQHPGILNPLWLLLKRCKQNMQRRPQTNSISDSIQPPSEAVQLAKNSYNINDETLAQKIRRYVLSGQALLDASKSWLVLSALFVLFYKIKRKQFDVVITSGPTSNAHLLGLLAKKLFGARWILDLRDPITIWDEIYPWCNSKWRRSIEDALERQYIKQADSIVCTSPSLIIDIEQNFPHERGKTELIYNGFDDPLPESPQGVTGKLKLMYAGALYMNRNPLPLFEAIEELVNEPGVDRALLVFDLYGSCQQWNGIDLINWVKQHKLTDVILIHGSVSPQEVQERSLLSNVLVNFAQNQPKQIPAKTFDQIACCKEVLLISEPRSDSAELIQKQGFGQVANSDKCQLKVILRELYQYYVINCTEYPIGRMNRVLFSRESQNSKYLELILKID